MVSMSAVALLVVTTQLACAQVDPNSDLRDLIVGMPIRPLPLAPTPTHANACLVRPAAIPIGGSVVPARSRTR